VIVLEALGVFVLLVAGLGFVLLTIGRWWGERTGRAWRDPGRMSPTWLAEQRRKGLQERP